MDINLPYENGVNSFFVGVNQSHSMMHSTSDMFESDLVDKLLWNPQFDVKTAYDGFKEIFSLLLKYGVDTDIPQYWKEQSASWRGFDAKIKWADNLLNLCNKEKDV